MCFWAYIRMWKTLMQRLDSEQAYSFDAAVVLVPHAGEMKWR
jgi:hypothetical protein